MADRSNESLVWLQRELDRRIAFYQSPPERRVGHGNLRHEYSSWKQDDDPVTNIAVIYETPGGSTTQLNVTYEHRDGTFHYLDSDLRDIVVTTDPKEALAALVRHVDTIPAKRLAQVDRQVETWMGQGKSKREVFGELNKLFQAEFLGGRLSTSELKAGIQHAIKLKAQQED